MSEKKKVELFALSTCGWCGKTKQWLEDNRIEHQVVYLDKVEGDEREKAQNRVSQFTPRLAFPVVVVNDGESVIQGFKPDKLEEALK